MARNIKLMTLLAAQTWGDKKSIKQILFIHGWGMNSSVWVDIANGLNISYPDYLITAVDLPGYGESASYTSETLHKNYNAQSLAQSLQPLLEEKQTILIAWSMGGLVAIELAATQKAAISQLILVSSTPRFVQGSHWPHAAAASLFEEFYQNCLKDHRATIKRFLAIQTMGSPTARQDIKFLTTQLLKRGEPDNKSLEYGLNMLLKEDKIEQFRQILNIPINLICGERDTLVHYRGQKQLAKQENITLYSIPTAGHAPFISHPEAFKDILQICL